MEYPISVLKSEINICDRLLTKFIDLIAEGGLNEEKRKSIKKQMLIVSDRKHDCEKAIKILLV